MDDRLIVHFPRLTAGDHGDHPLIGIFLDTPAEERAAASGKGPVSAFGIGFILFEHDLRPTGRLFRKMTRFSAVSVIADRKFFVGSRSDSGYHKEQDQD